METKRNLKVEYIPIDQLIPYARNAKLHSDEQVAKIAGSIREFGFINPVLIDDEGGIIAGHARVMAARKLGLTMIPCIKLKHLTETQKRAYIIADNRLSEIGSGWDKEMLQLEIEELNMDGVDLDVIGIDNNFLMSLRNENSFEPGSEDDQQRLDELNPKWITCPHCGKSFDARQV